MNYVELTKLYTNGIFKQINADLNNCIVLGHFCTDLCTFYSMYEVSSPQVPTDVLTGVAHHINHGHVPLTFDKQQLFK